MASFKGETEPSLSLTDQLAWKQRITLDTQRELVDERTQLNELTLQLDVSSTKVCWDCKRSTKSIRTRSGNNGIKPLVSMSDYLRRSKRATTTRTAAWSSQASWKGRVILKERWQEGRDQQRRQQWFRMIDEAPQSLKEAHCSQWHRQWTRNVEHKTCYHSFLPHKM